MRTHLIIPDTQCKPGVPADHLEWVGQYIVDKKPDVIVHLGDHADMESLSSYDRGKLKFEGRRYNEDIRAAHMGWDMINGPMEEHNARMREQKMKQYKPEKHILMGNHEERILRAVQDNPVLLGTIGMDDLGYDRYGWTVHPFLEAVEIDGIWYSHFFPNPMTGRPLGGVLSTRIKNVGFSFTMGHQQGKDLAHRYLANGEAQRGLVVGSCYLHNEDYKGPQGNHHWRGIVMKHEVRDGNYDLMEVSLNYLCRKYTGKTLDEYTPKTFY